MDTTGLNLDPAHPAGGREAPGSWQAGVTLSEDQEAALRCLRQAFNGVLTRLARGEKLDPRQRTLTLAGEAGTGKTLCMFELVRRLAADGHEVRLAAPTNKAARVLSDKAGRPAETLHKVAYQRPMTDEATGELMAFVRHEAGSVAHKLGTLLIADEASMVGVRLYDDVFAALSSEVVVLCVGDPAQLRPVKAAPAVDLDNPTARLTQVHRQAGAEHPILLAAQQVRRQQRGLTVDLLRSLGAKPYYVDSKYLGRFLIEGGAEVALTSSNRARWLVNQGARAARGAPPLVAGPRQGDRVMATSTNRGLEIPNGELGFVLGAREGTPLLGEPTWHVRVRWDAGGEDRVKVPRRAWHPDGPRPWDPQESAAVISRLRQESLTTKSGRDAAYNMLALQPAWACTVHKYQGSEAEKGVIVLEPVGRGTSWRLGYTALTRFKQQVDFVVLTDLSGGMRRGPAAPPPPLSVEDVAPEVIRGWGGC